MSESRTAARAALDAIAEAAQTAHRVRKKARSLPGKTAREVDEIAGRARALARVGEKKVRKNPGKFAKKADRLVGDLVRVTHEAIERAERRAESRAKADRAVIDAARAAADATVVASAPEPVAATLPVPVAAPVVASVVAAAPDVAVPDALADLTVLELRARARAAGYTGYSRLAKAQLVALLS